MLGDRLQGSGFGDESLKSRVLRLVLRFWGLRYRDWGVWLGVRSLGSGV